LAILVIQAWMQDGMRMLYVAVIGRIIGRKAGKRPLEAASGISFEFRGSEDGDRRDILQFS
jgi:hypothetical protein